MRNMQKILIALCLSGLSEQNRTNENGEIMFELKEQKINIRDTDVIMQSYKEKHLKRSRPYAPRKILKANFNSCRKGGR